MIYYMLSVAHKLFEKKKKSYEYVATVACAREKKRQGGKNQRQKAAPTLGLASGPRTYATVSAARARERKDKGSHKTGQGEGRPEANGRFCGALTVFQTLQPRQLMRFIPVRSSARPGCRCTLAPRGGGGSVRFELGE